MVTPIYSEIVKKFYKYLKIQLFDKTIGLTASELLEVWLSFSKRKAHGTYFFFFK